MIKIFNKRIIFTLISLLISQIAISTENYMVLDKIIGTVEKDIITESEFQRSLDKKLFILKSQNNSQVNLTAIKKEVLDELIEKKLIIQYANEIGLVPSFEEVELVIENIIEQNNISLDQFKNEIEKNFSSFEEFKDDIEFNLTLKKIKEREIMPYINVSKYEIEALIEDKKKKGFEQLEYKILHILIKDKSKKELIKKNIETIDFSEVAAKFSDGPYADIGGDLGWKKLEDLPEIFREKIKGMREKEIVEIVSGNGVHFLKLEDKKNFLTTNKIIVSQYKFQQILLKISPISSDEEIKNKLNNIKNLFQDGLSFNEAVKKYSEEAFVKDVTELEWVNINSLLPEFRNVFNNYPKEKILGPFKTDLGWHLVKIEDFRNFDVSSDSNKEIAKLEIIKKKADIRFVDWLFALKNNSVIKIFDM